MGTNLGPILTSQEITTSNLAGKKLVVDAFNALYQYLSSIRQRDGTPLMDSKGIITSHLSGLYFRTMNLMEQGLLLAYCFDGKAPELKKKEQQRRMQGKEEAEIKYLAAKETQDLEAMKKFASRTSKLTSEMISEATELIAARGLPIVQAPAEAEAEAAYLVLKGKAHAVVSQDTDSLLFGAPRVIRNLTVSERRRIKGTMAYEQVKPEEIVLSESLNTLGLDREQLIALGILCGTDFNIGGIKGIGPKKGLLLLKKHGKDFGSMFSEVEWDKHFDYSWKDVFSTIINMPAEDRDLSWGSIDRKKVIEILVDRHDFSRERVESALEKQVKKQGQKGLGEWF